MDDLKKFYLDGYEGTGQADSILVESNTTVRLPYRPCRFVQIFLWNTTNDESFALKSAPAAIASENSEELYWGFGGVLVGQLFTGDKTDLIPVSNTNQITIRKPKGTDTQVYFAWYK